MVAWRFRSLTTRWFVLPVPATVLVLLSLALGWHGVHWQWRSTAIADRQETRAEIQPTPLRSRVHYLPVGIAVGTGSTFTIRSNHSP